MHIFFIGTLFFYYQSYEMDIGSERFKLYFSEVLSKKYKFHVKNVLISEYPLESDKFLKFS